MRKRKFSCSFSAAKSGPRAPPFLQPTSVRAREASLCTDSPRNALLPPTEHRTPQVPLFLSTLQHPGFELNITFNRALFLQGQSWDRLQGYPLLGHPPYLYPVLPWILWWDYFSLSFMFNVLWPPIAFYVEPSLIS